MFDPAPSRTASALTFPRPATHRSDPPLRSATAGTHPFDHAPQARA